MKINLILSTGKIINLTEEEYDELIHHVKNKRPEQPQVVPFMWERFKDNHYPGIPEITCFTNT